MVAATAAKSNNKVRVLESSSHFKTPNAEMKLLFSLDEYIYYQVQSVIVNCRNTESMETNDARRLAQRFCNSNDNISNYAIFRSYL